LTIAGDDLEELDKGRLVAPLPFRTLRLLAHVIGGAGWLVLLLRGGQAILAYAAGPNVDSVYLYDWRVHYAGALDLLERDLYLDGGISLGAHQMPVDVFNLPPGAAALVLPLLPLGYDLGGLLWVSLGFVALIAGAWWFARLWDWHWAVAATGVLLFAYSLQPFFVRVTVLGNVNPLMVPLLVAFVWAHTRKKQRVAGALLGAAVALKVWPIALAPLLIRERRWLELAWASTLVAAQGLAAITWLGPNAPSALIDAVRTHVPIPPGVDVLWTSWAREVFAWWPAWGALGVAAGLLMVPARGRLGLGLGFLAGLSLIANIWDHYLPAFALAWVLILSSPEVRRMGTLAYDRVRSTLVPLPATSR
jgi:hypothetical protein